MRYQKRVLVLIAVAAVLKLVFSSAIRLGADEVYYWTFASNVQWNYFDHPPMVAWLIRLTTLNLLFHNEIFVRLGAIFCSAVCTWLMFKLGELFANQQTGWFAALLYTTSSYCSIVAGTYIMPDGPQMVFWLASILTLIKISRQNENIAKANMLWYIFGVMAGLCIMCKVHGVFLWLGALLYVFLIHRASLKGRGVYFAALITLVIITPIIIWNINNNFITYKFHVNRINPQGYGVDLLVFMKVVLAQAVNSNPLNFILIYISLITFFKGMLPGEKREINILLFCNLPLVVTILLLSLFKETYPYWPGPAYGALTILPAIWLDRRSKKVIPRVIKWAFAYLVFIAGSQILIINYFPGTLSKVKEGPKTGAGDLTLDSFGWREAGKTFDSLYNNDVANYKMPAFCPVVVTNWNIGAAVEYYFTYKTKQQVIGIGGVTDLHQYYWTNKDKQLKDGDAAYFIVPSDGFSYRTSHEVNLHFAKYDNPVIITQYRSGFVCRYFFIYRMRGYSRTRLQVQ